MSQPAFSMVCETCGTTFDYEPAMFGGREIFKPLFCDACIEIHRAKEDEEKARDRLGARREAWREMCPSAYRKTDLTHPGLSKAVREALDRWHPKTGRSLGLCGPTGMGKTRLSFSRLENLYMEGWDVFFISSKKLERMVHWKFSDDHLEKSEAQGISLRVRTCRILLLDDLGKEKFTERVAGEAYDLVEHRTSNDMPIIWTCNVGMKTLKERLGEEHGDATVRRLLEFSEVTKA